MVHLMFFLFSAFNGFLFTQQNVMKRCVIILLKKNVFEKMCLFWVHIMISKNDSLFF